MKDDDEPIEGLGRVALDENEEGLSSASEDDAFFLTAKEWFRRDVEHSADWRKQALEDYDFVAGEQWSSDDKEKLRTEMRPHVTFNRIGPVIDAVSGLEIQNRQEVRYIPRTQGDVQVNELLTSAAQFMRDQCDAEDEDTDAFLDTTICGMGWTESRLDFEEDPEGAYVVDRIDPLEMAWDSSARKRNLVDAKRFWRVREFPVSEAKALFPGMSAYDLHAAWAAFDDTGKDEPHDNDDAYQANKFDEAGNRDPGDKVKVVQIQWCESEPFVKLVDPMTGQMAEMSVEEFGVLEKRMKAMGLPLQSVTLTRRTWYHAFLGAKVLKREKNLCPERASWECITGKRDRNKGTFYGLVHPMKDPQRWANKWLSQSLHILNVNAKGGVMAERGAFEDDREAEATWSDPSRMTWTKPGALQNGKVQQKQPPALPAGPEKFLDLAISSIRDVSGVNLELLGLRDANQAGVLEAQRKQAGMTILAHLFDNLRRYRKRTGRTLLHYITNYLSDGRLVRIVGEEQEQYVPLVRQPGIVAFDVIVDENPTSTNAKEQVWGSLMQLMPVLQNTLPPQALLPLLDYSILPSSVVEKIKKGVEEAQQAGAQGQEEAKKLAIAKEQADMGLKQAQTAKTEAEAKKTQVETLIATVTPITPPMTANVSI